MSISIRFEKCKSGLCTSKSNHIDRTKIPDYINKDKTNLNEVIKENIFKSVNPNQLFEIIDKARKKKGQIGLRFDACLAKDFILTFDNETADSLDKLSSEVRIKFFRDFLEKFNDKFLHNSDLLIAYTHRDEAHLHLQFMVSHYYDDVKSGKILPLKFNPKDLSKMQDVASECLVDSAVINKIDCTNINFNRGKSKMDRIKDNESSRNYTHQTVKEFRDNLDKEYADLQDKNATLNMLMEINKTYLIDLQNQVNIETETLKQLKAKNKQLKAENKDDIELFDKIKKVKSADNHFDDKQDSFTSKLLQNTFIHKGI